MSFESDLYGYVYKSQKTKNAAAKRKKTNSNKEQMRQNAYNQAFERDAQTYAKKNNITGYSKEDLGEAARAYYGGKKQHQKFLDWSERESASRNRAELKSHASFASDEDGQSKTKEYNEARKKMGMQPDNMVTQKKYDQMFGYDTKKGFNTGTINRYQQYLESRNSKDMKVNHNEKKPKASSFAKTLDKIVDKGLHGANNFVDEYAPGVKKDIKSLIKSEPGQTVLKGLDTLDRYTTGIMRNMADTNIKDLNETQKYIDEQKKQGKDVKLKTQSFGDLKKFVKKEATDSIDNKRRANLVDVNKNAGISTGSKYGDKALAFIQENALDPTNIVGAGVAKGVLKGVKALKGAKTAEEAVKTFKNTNGISKMNAKKIIEEANKVGLPEVAAPKQFKSLNDLKANVKAKQEAVQELITPKEIQPKSINQKPVDYVAQKNELSAIHDADRQQFAAQNKDVIHAVSSERQRAVDQFNKEDMEWQGHEAAAKQYDDIMKSVGGRLNIPTNNMNDFASQLGKHMYSAAGKGQGDDIYKVADDLGFNNPDELIQTLNNGYTSKQVIKAGKNRFYTVDGKKLQDPNPESIIDEMHAQTPSSQQLRSDMAKMDQLHNEQQYFNEQQPVNTAQQIEAPASVADNFQNAISKARETNNPQDIESIKQHTQDLINDLDVNYKDPDIEEVKNDLSKLNLQLFAGKEPVQETLSKIEGVVERAKTLKKDIKETNPQLAKEIQGIKDINSVGKASRNLYEVVAKLPKQMQKAILDVLNKAKPDNVNYQKMYVEDLNRYIVDPKTGLGIKKGSKDSALVQDYGEKTLAKKELEKQGLSLEEINKMNPEELAKMNDEILKNQYPDKYESIKKADNFFRERYKELIDAANSTIAKIYPGQPDKLIPERADYYHHFNEMEGLEGVINQFRTPENINPDLVTISHGTQPKTKWQAFKQKRGLGEYKSDAVGGFLKYIQGVSHTTHVDPVIPAIRNVVKDLQNATEDTKNINNIIEALNDHADDIAGKTNPYDRTIQKILGRANLRRLNALNGRVKSNMILGNVGSTVAQVGNLPLIAAKAKHHLPTGLYDTLEQFSRYAVKNKKDLPINKSKFLRERFIDEDFNKFDTKILDQPKKLAVKMMTMVDKATASLAWNSFHRQGLAKKVPNPIEYADKLTRDTIAGRGVGEMGLGQKSKTAQIFMPFTYEVGHQWKVLNNMVGKKDAAGIMTFLITSYALNKVIEDVRGSGVSFDPIDALIDGYQNGEGDKKHKVLAALGSLSGEVVGNIPGGNTLTSAIGDKGLLGSDVTLKDVFQDRDPNRFGSGLTVSKAIESPSFALLPFGANQVKKGWESHKAIKDGGVFTKKGEMMYPVDTSSNLKKAQMFTFGKYSPSEARDYFDEKRKPLSLKRTEKVQKADDKFKEYNNQLIQLLENKKKRSKGDLNKLKKLDQQIAELKEKNK